MTEELYILRDVQWKLEDYNKEQIVFNTETLTWLQQIQADLKHLEKKVIEQNYEISRIKEKIEKHDITFIFVWWTIIVISFFIIWLFAK